MNNLKKAALCLVAMLMTLTAYAAESDLYGRWVQSENEGGMVAIISYEFTPDGKVQEMNISTKEKDQGLPDIPLR